MLHLHQNTNNVPQDSHDGVVSDHVRHADPSAESTSVERINTQGKDSEPAVRRSASASRVTDLEDQAGPEYPHKNDPLRLHARLKSSNEIKSIRSNIFNQNTSVIPLSFPKDAFKARKVHNFYKEQNENILRLLKPVADHRRQAKEENDSSATQYKIAVNGSFAANLALAVLQVYGAVASGSLSLFTTMADALFDPCSNLTLILCNRAVNRVNPRKFPQGKARIETAGNIAFCFLMCAVSFILIVTSAKEITQGSTRAVSDFHLPSIIAVAIAFVTKLCLFLYCYSLRHRYSQIHILWEDHRNDLMINGFGIMTSVLGSKVHWWIDPLGAIVLSILIAGLWLSTAWSEFQLLIGVSADPNMLQLITYICQSPRPFPDIKVQLTPHDSDNALRARESN